MNKEIFVQNVKELCFKKGVKPTNACKECGVGGSFLSDINRGQTPSVAKVEALAQYLDVTVSELLGEIKKTTPEDGDGLNAEHKELVSLYDAASPALRTAAIAVLRSADGHIIEVEPGQVSVQPGKLEYGTVTVRTKPQKSQYVFAYNAQRPKTRRKDRLKKLAELLETAQSTKGSGSGH